MKFLREKITAKIGDKVWFYTMGPDNSSDFILIDNEIKSGIVVEISGESSYRPFYTILAVKTSDEETVTAFQELFFMNKEDAIKAHLLIRNKKILKYCNWHNIYSEIVREYIHYSYNMVLTTTKEFDFDIKKELDGNDGRYILNCISFRLNKQAQDELILGIYLSEHKDSAHAKTIKANIEFIKHIE